jgi:hypothetical protein
MGTMERPARAAPARSGGVVVADLENRDPVGAVRSPPWHQSRGSASFIVPSPAVTNSIDVGVLGSAVCQ